MNLTGPGGGAASLIEVGDRDRFVGGVVLHDGLLPVFFGGRGLNGVSEAGGDGETGRHPPDVVDVHVVALEGGEVAQRRPQRLAVQVRVTGHQHAGLVDHAEPGGEQRVPPRHIRSLETVGSNRGAASGRAVRRADVGKIAGGGFVDRCGHGAAGPVVALDKAVHPTECAAELEGVFAFDPGQVIAELVSLVARSAAAGAPGIDIDAAVERSLTHHERGGGPRNLRKWIDSPPGPEIAGIAEVQLVGKPRSKAPQNLRTEVTRLHGNLTAGSDLPAGATGEPGDVHLRGLVHKLFRVAVGRCQPPVTVEVMVQARHAEVHTGRVVAGPGEVERIESIAAGGVVAGRQLVPQGTDDRAQSAAAGIESPDIVRDNVPARVAEAQDTLPQFVAGHQARDRSGFRESPPFIVSEQEGFVLDHRSAQRDAKAVVFQFRPLDSQAVERPCVGVQVVVLVIPIRRAVHDVRAPLGHHTYLAAGGTAESSVGIGGGNAEFLHTLKRHRDHRRGSAPVDCGSDVAAAAADEVSRVRAVETERVLVAAHTGDLPGQSAEDAA